MEMAYWALAPLGIRLARLGVSANSITFASLGFGASAGVALGTGHFGIGAALSAVSALGDALDGFVARASGTSSDAGEVLDAAVDRYSEFFFLAGLAVFYRGSVGVLVLVLGALLGSFMVSYATAKAEALQVVPPRGTMRRAERATYLTIAAGVVPFFALARGEGTGWLADLPVVFVLMLVAVVANVSAARRLIRTAALTRTRPGSARVDGGRLDHHTDGGNADDLSPVPEPARLEAAEQRSVVR
jgi:CDP-diacylglycerol---glycerol-3-phosphate 3-phosphatidyltransferase